MDAGHQARLETLKQEQADLRLRLDQLGQRISDLENELSKEVVKSTLARGLPAASATPVQPARSHQPPPLPVAAQVASAPEAICSECGAKLPATSAVHGESGLCVACGMARLSEKRKAAASVEVSPKPEVQPPVSQPVTPLPVMATTASKQAEEAGPEESSLEMRLGTHWFVRVGAISILTGLVFLANYAYKNWIFARSPAVKVTLLYLLSFGLAGTGWFLQRWQEQLRRYGQVLMATGLAAVYFTTYAAHYFPNLRVIESPLVAGSLLFGLAGFIVWFADRNKSEALAMFAIGLAYYTSVINEVKLFTLFSNLALTLAAVFFLIRNRWAALSFASLVATYGSFFYWRFYQDHRWLWRFDLSPENFWLGALFLAGYWVAFTASVFLSKHEQFGGGQRAAFLSLNNGAFFGFTAWTLHLAYPGMFWKFALGFGAVLLALAALASRTLKDDPTARNAYTTKGLILVTIGFLAHFSGPRLSLILAGQSVAMIVMGYLLANRVVRAGAYLVGGLAAMLALDDFKPFDTTGLLMGASVGAFLAFNGWWVDWRKPEKDERTTACPKVAYFVALGLLVWFLAAWHNTAAELRAPLYAGLALAFTGSWYALRLRELATLGQGYLLAAQLLWLAKALPKGEGWPWWNPMTVIVATLGLGHWWQHQKTLNAGKELRQVFQAIYGLAVVLVLHRWLQPQVSAPNWLWLTSVLAIVLTAYGLATRAWFVALCGQIFLVISGGQFFEQIMRGSPPWFFALAPIATLALLGLAVVTVLRQTDAAESETVRGVLRVSFIYRAAATLMSVVWIVEYVPMRERFWVFALCGLALFLWAGWMERPEALWFSGVFTVVGFAHYWLNSRAGSMTYLPNVFAVLTLAAQQQLARRKVFSTGHAEALHTAVIILVSATLWLFFTQWVHRAGSGFYHTAVWAVLAFVLFLAGLPLRESVYRRCGMALLALALGRVALVDIWKLETIYKIISCIGLGAVLLLLGFIYNRFQTQIRRWL
jgi:uncharacterized membrane protein